MRRTHAAVIGKSCLIAVVVSLALLGVIARGAAQGQVVTLVGRVQWIAGEKMMLIPDNGDLPVEIDLRKAPLDNYLTLTENDPVIVSGEVSSDGRKVIATSIQRAGRVRRLVMKRSAALFTLATWVFIAAQPWTGYAWAQGLPTATPEEVGLSSQKLARVTDVVKSEIAKGRYPGAVALVARRGKVAYFEALGQRDPLTGAPMAKDAIFRLYSMTKPFTSVAAMMLVEDGRILLNDPVSKYIPKLANLQVSVPRFDPTTSKTVYDLVPAEREMTIQDLLRHTSGLVYGPPTSHAKVKELYAAEGVDWNNVTPAEQIERIAKVPLAHQPGTAWEYSLSTDVMGRVIESVTGAPLGQFFEARIFTPLRMTDTAFLVPNGKAARLAQPFAKDPVTGNPVALLDVTVPQKNDAGGAGSAGTAADYARFSQMLLNGGQLDGTRLLGRATVAHMSADHVGDIRVASPHAPARLRLRARLRRAQGDGPQLGHGLGRRVPVGRRRGHRVLGRPEGTDGRRVDDTGRSPARCEARTGTCSASSSRRQSSTEARTSRAGAGRRRDEARPMPSGRRRASAVGAQLEHAADLVGAAAGQAEVLEGPPLPGEVVTEHGRAERDEAVDDGRGHAGGVAEGGHGDEATRHVLGDVLVAHRRGGSASTGRGRSAQR